MLFRKVKLSEEEKERKLLEIQRGTKGQLESSEVSTESTPKNTTKKGKK